MVIECIWHFIPNYTFGSFGLGFPKKSQWVIFTRPFATFLFWIFSQTNTWGDWMRISEYSEDGKLCLKSEDWWHLCLGKGGFLCVRMPWLPYHSFCVTACVTRALSPRCSPLKTEFFPSSGGQLNGHNSVSLYFFTPYRLWRALVWDKAHTQGAPSLGCAWVHMGPAFQKMEIYLTRWSRVL